MITYANTRAVTRPAEFSINQELRLCKKNKDAEIRQGKRNKSAFLTQMVAQIGRQAALRRLQQAHKPSEGRGSPGAGAPGSTLPAAPAALPHSPSPWPHGGRLGGRRSIAHLPPPSPASRDSLSWGGLGKEGAASPRGVPRRMLPEPGEGNCSPGTCKTLPRATGAKSELIEKKNGSQQGA